MQTWQRIEVLIVHTHMSRIYHYRITALDVVGICFVTLAGVSYTNVSSRKDSPEFAGIRQNVSGICRNLLLHFGSGFIDKLEF